MNFEITRWPPSHINVQGDEATDARPDVLRLFLTKVLGRTRTLAASAVVGAALVGGVSPLFPPSYEATSELLIDPRGFGVDSNVVLDANAAINFIESQMRLMSSDTVLREVLQGEWASDSAPEEPVDPIGDALADMKAWLGLASQTAQESPTDEDGAAGKTARTEEDFSRDLEILRHSLSVARFDRSYVVNVTVEDVSRHRAAERVNKIVASFLAEAAENRAAVKRAGRLGEIDRRIALAEAEMLDRAGMLGVAHPEVRRLKQSVDALKQQQQNKIVAAREIYAARSLENAFLRVISPARPANEKSFVKRAVVWTGVGAMIGVLVVLALLAFTCAQTIISDFVSPNPRTDSKTGRGDSPPDDKTKTAPDDETKPE